MVPTAYGLRLARSQCQGFGGRVKRVFDRSRVALALLRQDAIRTLFQNSINERFCRYSVSGMAELVNTRLFLYNNGIRI